MFYDVLQYSEKHFATNYLGDFLVLNGAYCERRYFHGFMKMGNSAWINTRVLSITGSIGYYKSNFQSVFIFTDI